MNRYHNGSSTVEPYILAQPTVENSACLRTICNLDFLPATALLFPLQDSGFVARAAEKSIKNKLGETRLLAMQTLHAKRAPLEGNEFIDENGGGPGRDTKTAPKEALTCRSLLRQSPLQEDADKGSYPAHPKQPRVIASRAEKFGHIGRDTAGPCELIEAFEGSLSDHLGIKVLPPGCGSNQANYAKDDEPRTKLACRLAAH